MANEFKIKKGLIVNGSGSIVLDIQGSQGQLFSVTDQLTGTLFSVSDISGIPILEVDSDDTIRMGTFGSEAIIVSGSHATVSGSFSGSFQGDGQSQWDDVTGGINYASGNVGIGTTSPGAKLEIEGSSEPGIRLRETGGSNYYDIKTNGSIAWFGDRANSMKNLVVTAGGGAEIRTNGDLVAFKVENIAPAGSLYIKGTTGNVGIGTTSPSEKLEVAGRISISNTGKSVFLGNRAGENDDFSDNGNTAIGEQSLRANILGIENVAIGYSSLLVSTANRNTAVGVETLRINSTGQNNTALGHRAMYYNQTGSSNVALGFSALWRLTSGIRNVVIGDQSGIATSTGNLTVANDSIFIGAGATALGDNQTNQVVIGRQAQGLGSNTVVLGNSSVVTTQLQGNVGIGTTSPSFKLEVAGTINQTVLQGAPSDNLNNILSTRYFSSHTATTNAPSGITSFGMGLSINYGSNASMQLMSSRGNTTPLSMRKFTNGTWTGWIDIIDSNKISDADITSWDSGVTRWNGTTGTGNNWNNIDENSFITGHTSTLNYPPELSQSFLSGIATMYDSDDGWQVASNRNSVQGVYFRKVQNGTWSSWNKFIDSRDIYVDVSNGNIGIGTTSPSFKLDVAGTGNFTGLVSGITPVNAANFVTKAYADGLTPGAGVFLPLTGGTLTGNLTITGGSDIFLADNGKTHYGASNDLEVFHNGSDSYIIEKGTGDLRLQTTNGTAIKLQSGTEDMIVALANSSVSLYHDSIKKLETATTGITITGKASSTATITSDSSATLTTKGYVDSLITGATIYRGAWDPSGGGYGSPDLSTVTQTSGYYYICSATGTAEPNGTGTEPDTWAVGDWVIYNDVSGTGQWQKIDNSSVLSGVGTGQTVALWEGAGSVTDSETLGNAPITVSGNNTTFAGTVTLPSNKSVNWPGGSIRAEGNTLKVTATTLIDLQEDTQVQGTLQATGQISGSSIQVVGGGTNNFFSANTNAIAEFKPSNTRSGIQPILVYRASVNGSANYMLSSGANTLFGLYDSGVPSDVSGMVKITPNNTSEAPTVHIGDTGSNAAALNVGGNIKLLNNGISYINGGNVGIGTTSPNAKLEVVGVLNSTDHTALISAEQSSLTFTSNYAGLYVANTNQTDGNYARINFGDGDDAASSAIGSKITSHSSNYSNLEFWTRGSTGFSSKMLIEENGNVGIGTTSPTSKLTVSSDVAGDGSWNDSGILIENTSTTSTGEPTLSFRNAGAAGTGANYWHTGLNQSTTYKIAYGTSFTDGGTKLELGTNGNFRLNAYGLGNLGGTGNFLLGVTTTGDIYEANAADLPGGPYLPLAGGTLTGNTNLTGSTKKLILKSGAQLGFEDATPTGTIYLYNDGAATSRLNIGGTMWVEEAGNVGIGTDNPGQKLQVAGSIYANGGSMLIDSGQRLKWGNSNQWIEGTNNTSLEFSGGGGGTQMILTSAGNVGIGTTSPGYKLDVNGSTNSTSLYVNTVNQHVDSRYSAPNNQVAFSRTSTSDQWFKIITAGGTPVTHRVSIISDGDNTNMRDEYLINTAGYSFNTHIQRLPGTRYNTSKLVAIAVVKASNTVVDIWIKLLGMSSGSGTTAIYSNTPIKTNTEILASATTTAPTLASSDTQLDITGTNRSDTTLMTSRGATFGGNVGIGTTSPQTLLNIESTTAPTLRISNGGGTSPAPKLEFYRQAGVSSYIQYDVANKILVTDNAHASGVINYKINGSEKMRIASDGNVGIGTTAPGAKLDISGDLRIDGYSTTTNEAGLYLYNNISYNMASLANCNSSYNAFRIRGRNTATNTLAFGSNGNSDYVFQVVNDAGTVSGNISINPYGGNVGIGTTTPGKLLEVKSSTAYNSTVRLSTTAHNWDIQGGETGYSSTAFALDYDGATFFRAIGTTDARFSGGLSVGTINATPPTGGLYVAGNVGIGTTSPSYKLQVAGGISAGGKTTYSKAAGSLDMTGYAVAGLTTGNNGSSAGFVFTCFGHTGKYQKVVYSCWNSAGTWNTSKVIDEGTNDFDIEASANGTTITFTFKSRSGTKSYTPNVTVEATGQSINNTYA